MDATVQTAVIAASASVLGGLFGAGAPILGQHFLTKRERSRAYAVEQRRLIAELGALCIDDLTSFHDIYATAADVGVAAVQIARSASRRQRLARKSYLLIDDQSVIDAVERAYTMWGHWAQEECDFARENHITRDDDAWPATAIDDVASRLRHILFSDGNSVRYLQSRVYRGRWRAVVPLLLVAAVAAVFLWKALSHS